MQALSLRLQQMSAGVTHLKAEAILSVFPNKRLLLRYIATFALRESLAADLEVRALVPPLIVALSYRTCCF